MRIKGIFIFPRQTHCDGCLKDMPADGSMVLYSGDLVLQLCPRCTSKEMKRMRDNPLKVDASAEGLYVEGKETAPK